MQNPSAILIFAAGFGTRMGALTVDQPKPLIRVAGKPLIDHALDLVNDTEMSKVVVNLHYRAQQLRDHLTGREVVFSEEQPEILETGGGLRAALPLLGCGPVFTMNSDAVWRGPNAISLLRSGWDPKEMDGLLLCVEPENAIGHKGQGDFLVDDSGRVTRGAGLVYSGVQIIKTGALPEITENVFSLNVLWNRMIADKRLFALRYPGYWCDVGHPEGIAMAENLLEYRDV